MSARTVEEQIEALLGRRVAEAKVRGAPSPDAEAIAVFESITLNLLLRPKAMLYVMHLARNGLVRTCSDEIELIDELKAAISDLGNPSFDVRSTRSLEKARGALLQLEGLDKISTDSGAFKRFEQSVNEFLEKHLSKSVRRPGQTSLVRPGEEASVDVGTLFNELKELHAEYIERLYALLVGVENFLESPMSTILGLSTAARARADIEEIIESLEEDPSSTLARDMAIRLIGNRASLKVIGQLPSPYEPVLDTVEELPLGYVVHAASEPATAVKTSLPGPFVLPVGAQIQAAFNGSLVPTTYLIPQSTFDLNNRAFIVSEVFTDPASYPITVPAYTYLFISIDLSDGTRESYRVLLNDTNASTSVSFNNVLSLINAALGSAGGALEYINAGSGRILIYANPGTGPFRDRIYIAPSHSEPSASTLGILATYYQTAHAELGFIMGQSGSRGLTPTYSIVDALNRHFAGTAVATRNPDDSFTIETLSDELSAQINILSAPSALGITGMEFPKTNTFRLLGTVFGVPTDPIAAEDLVDIGDRFLGGDESTIQGFNEGKIVLADPIPSYDGPIVVSSILAEKMQVLDALLPPYLEEFGQGRFAENLNSIDAAIAILGSNATPAQRNTVIRLLDELRVQVVELKGILEDPTTLLPALSASRERTLVNGIISTLTERKYDRALSFLLKCKVQELLSMSSDEASFGGTLMRSMSDLAQADVTFPNAAQDDGDVPKMQVKRSGT